MCVIGIKDWGGDQICFGYVQCIDVDYDEVFVYFGNVVFGLQLCVVVGVEIVVYVYVIVLCVGCLGDVFGIGYQLEFVWVGQMYFLIVYFVVEVVIVVYCVICQIVIGLKLYCVVKIVFVIGYDFIFCDFQLLCYFFVDRSCQFSWVLKNVCVCVQVSVVVFLL